MATKRAEHLAPSDTHTVCRCKGTASYRHVTVGGATNPDAAWWHPRSSRRSTGRHSAPSPIRSYGASALP